MTYNAFSSGCSYALNIGVLAVPDLYVLSVRRVGWFPYHLISSRRTSPPGATEAT
jgi:hypothetical protein